MTEPKTAQPFLVTHDKCPVCGSTKRLGQQVVDKLKLDGALPQAFPYAGITLQAALLDPLHPPAILATTFTIKVILMSMDVCAEPDCGAVYCTGFNVVDQAAQMAPPGQQPRGFTPSAGPNRAERRRMN